MPSRVPIHNIADYGERLVSSNRTRTILNGIQERSDIAAAYRGELPARPLRQDMPVKVIPSVRVGAQAPLHHMALEPLFGHRLEAQRPSPFRATLNGFQGGAG